MGLILSRQSNVSLAREAGPALSDLFLLRQPERTFEPQAFGREIRRRILTDGGSVQPRYVQALIVSARDGYAGIEPKNLCTVLCRIAAIEIAFSKFFKEDGEAP